MNSTAMTPSDPASDAAMAALARLFPAYDLRARVATNSSGATYRARHRKLERDVAIKIVTPQPGDSTFAERFLRESRTTASLDHPYVVTVHDYGEVDGVWFQIRELCSNRTLRGLLRSGEPGRKRAMQLFADICSAVRTAHAAGVVHGNLTPESVMLDTFGYPRVTDFGFARSTSRSYTAPETSTDRAAGAPADVYSLGAILYEILTGHPPTSPSTPPADSLRSDLDDLVMRALDPNAATRPSVQELEDATRRPSLPRPIHRASTKVTPPVSRRQPAQTKGSSERRVEQTERLVTIAGAFAMLAAFLPWVTMRHSFGRHVAYSWDVDLHSWIELPGWFVIPGAILVTAIVATKQYRKPFSLRLATIVSGVFLLLMILLGITLWDTRTSMNMPGMEGTIYDLIQVAPEFGLMIAGAAFAAMFYGLLKLNRLLRTQQRRSRDARS